MNYEWYHHWSYIVCIFW